MTLDSALQVLKNPALGNSVAGIMVILGAFVLWYPAASPFAYADHMHDISKVQAVITDTVNVANIQTFMQLAEDEIDDIDRQIQFNLCFDAGCAFEKAKVQSLKRKIETLERQMDRLNRGVTQP